MQNVFNFLRELIQNNHRDWFEQHREQYRHAKEEFETFVAFLIPLVAELDPDVGLLSPKETMFRIYRDVRFSKDKRPYKTNMGSFITKGGKKSPFAGYYFHLEPGNSFLGGGAYMPPPKALKAIREQIFENPAEFRKLIEAPDFANYFDLSANQKLKTAPRGFPKDFPDIELLRFKGYAVMHPLTNQQVLAPDLTDTLKTGFEKMKPLNDYLNRAIGRAYPA